MRTFPQTILDRFDIIGFDPRGVGQSAPVRCETTPTPTPAVTPTPEPFTLERAETAVAQYGRICRESVGDELDFLDTTSSARDIERIRIALGEESIAHPGDIRTGRSLALPTPTCSHGAYAHSCSTGPLTRR